MNWLIVKPLLEDYMAMMKPQRIV